MIWSHPHPEMLIDHVAAPRGGIQDLLIDIHADLCPECRRQLNWLTRLGGLALERAGAIPVSPGLAATVSGRLDDAVQSPPSRAPAHGALPPSLVAFLGDDAEGIRWRRLLPGVRRHVIGEADGWRAELLRIEPGRRVPRHTHVGGEVTLVLLGGFHDGIAHYGPGDICFADASIRHQPVADRSGVCICFTMSKAPPYFTGTFSRLLNLFAGGRGREQ